MKILEDYLLELDGDKVAAAMYIGKRIGQALIASGIVSVAALKSGILNNKIKGLKCKTAVYKDSKLKTEEEKRVAFKSCMQTLSKKQE